MNWEPATRVGFNEETCAHDDCRERNNDTSFYVVEGFDTMRYLCREHYLIISKLFYFVSRCDRCFRNRMAELDKCMLDFFSLKFDGRVYDVCESHRTAYDSLIVPLY